MTFQAFFFLRKQKVKKLKCRLLQLLFGALKVKTQVLNWVDSTVAPLAAI